MNLPATSPVFVHVVDLSGTPRPGVEVVERGFDERSARGKPSRAGSSVDPRTEHDALPHFHRRFTTDVEGRAQVHPCGFPIVLQARTEGEGSSPLVAWPGETELELVLQPTAGALGSILFPAGFNRADEVRVSVFGQRRGSINDSDLVLLGTARIAESGEWGPLEVAVEDGFDLLFRLVGGGLVPEERAVDPRSSSAPYIVDFAPSVGVALRAFIHAAGDVDLRGIENARVEFTWREEGSDKVSSVVGWTDADGLVEVQGCPDTTGSVRASAKGHASSVARMVAVPTSVRLDMALDPGGAISGRCMHAGAPVQDFDLVIWKDTAESQSRHIFRDRKDGEFHLEGTPFGTVQVIALPFDLPESETHSVLVSTDSVSRMEIEVPQPVTGRGRIVDASTGDPIRGAHVTPLTVTGLNTALERGQRYSADADGWFEIPSCSSEDMFISAFAAGYGLERSHGSYTPGTGVEFGEIALSPAGDLTVRVLVDRELREFELWVNSDGTNPIPYHAVPTDGTLLLTDVQPGHHNLHLVWQDTNGMTRRVNLVPGRPWIEEFEMGAGKELTIDLVADEGMELPVETALFASHRDSKGEMVIGTWLVPEDKHLVIRDFAADEVWLEVVNEQRQLLASDHLVLEPGAPRYYEMRIRDRSLLVAVFDLEANPLPESQVVVSLADVGQLEGSRQSSDADGTALFRGLAADEVVVLVSHPSHGTQSLRVELEPEGQTVAEVVLDGGSDLEVRVIDGETLIPGVSIRLFSPDTSLAVGDRRSNSEGTAIWPRLSDGRYHTHIDQIGLWETWLEFEFAGSAEPIDMPVRRLGNLEVQVVDPEGMALGGVGLTLRSVEFGESVATWVEANRVLADPVNLATGPEGILGVQNIPRGPYLLEFTSPTGSVVQQSLVVPPADTLRHLVVLE